MKIVCTVLGIRPDFIRMSKILKKLDNHPRISHIMIHTGQHYDKLLSSVFFEELSLRSPDLVLQAGTSSTNHYEQLAYLATTLPPLFQEIRPDLIVFLGDSNTVAVSVALKKQGYNICHIEAGMRSGDRRMLEEINRTVCDHCSDLLFVYHEDYKQNLLRENIKATAIHVVGNTIVEPLQDFIEEITSHPRSHDFILMDIHRPENFRNPLRLRQILLFGNECARRYNVPVFLLDFPSLRKPLEDQELDEIETIPLLSFQEYLEKVYHSLFLISDSGTGQEEPALLGTRVLTPRDFTERPQSYAGKCSFHLRLTPLNTEDCFRFIDDAEPMDLGWLGNGDTSDRVIRGMEEFLFLSDRLAYNIVSHSKDVEPFPHVVVDDILPEDLARAIQEECLGCDLSLFDRYDNPFEQKYTFRDKNHLPRNCRGLFDALQSPEVMDALRVVFGKRVVLDEHKHYWGIHRYKKGDFLDIHVDADLHPVQRQKKYLTLGLYLSPDWRDEDRGHLELWRGSDCDKEDRRLYQCVKKITPRFNRMLIFECTRDAWHGNPTPVARDGRLFLTMSYLTDEISSSSERERALFIGLPDEPEDPAKDELRRLRASSGGFKDVYRRAINRET